ncbi:MAG: hypothetical protein E6767_16485 [Dysgonomonas sp.]|nr:hypothetical protein [Dysgonomonas sp.]
MKFEIDNQTKKDLEIFDTYKTKRSVLGLFNHTECVGGKQKLYKFLSTPLSDLNKINERKDAIEFLQQAFPSGFNLDKNALDFTEYYFRQGNYPTRAPSWFGAIERKFMDKISPGHEYYLVEKGVSSTVDLLKMFYRFALKLADKLKVANPPKLLFENDQKIQEIFSKPEFKDVIDIKRVKAYDTARFDYLFRYTNKDDIFFLVNIIYEYDAFFAIAKGAQLHKLSYPEVLPASDNELQLEGLFHPFIDDAVSNDVSFDRASNLLFISGPNMAGKSTFLKALGVAVYLAHVGFPVPAKAMRMSLLSGLCTTINISDDLSSGYSHFYAEVMRIKNVAERLQTNPNMLVIFDELFRGTNVKDAFDGTLAVVSAFSQIKDSFFVISTHIVEVADELKSKDNIQFGYFEIKEENGHPAYTYKLKNGVSTDRLGMYIIRREGLIELINNINKVERQ